MLARSPPLCKHIICPPTHVSSGQHVLCFCQAADIFSLYWSDAGTKEHQIIPRRQKTLLITDKRILTPIGELWCYSLSSCETSWCSTIKPFIRLWRSPLVTVGDHSYRYFMDDRKNVVLSFMLNMKSPHANKLDVLKVGWRWRGDLLQPVTTLFERLCSQRSVSV